MAVPDMWIKLLKVKYVFVFCPNISTFLPDYSSMQFDDPEPALQVNPDTDPVSDPDARF
jgi:hypothetical protein